MNYMRNKQTGEIREVEPDSPEFITLKQLVGPDGRSLWEQTGDHHVGALAERADAGSLTEVDLGQEDQERLRTLERTEIANPAHEPWRDLTAAEREAGLTEESKAEQLEQELSERARTENAGVFSEAADKIAGGVPDGFPVEVAHGTPAEEFEDSDSGGWESKSASKADLQAEAESRGLSTSGTKDEIRARIEADTNANV